MCLEFLDEGSHYVTVDGSETELPVLKLEDARKGRWVLIRDPKLPLVVEYSTPYFTQRLKSVVHPENNSLRWIKKLPPVQ